MLNKIQDIKVRRKDIAEREFIAQKRVVVELEKKVQQKKKELDDYVASIPRLEDELFAKIFNKAVFDKDFDNYKAEMRKIHEHAEYLKEKLEEIKQELKRAEKILEEKRLALIEAQKKVEKFNNLIETQEEEERFIATVLEDNEIEESFRPPTEG